VIVFSTRHVIPPIQVFLTTLILIKENTEKEPTGTEEEPNPKADIKFSITETKTVGGAGGTTVSKIYVFKSFLPPLTLKFLKNPNRCL
jgi:hypothetical protein